MGGFYDDSGAIIGADGGGNDADNAPSKSAPPKDSRLVDERADQVYDPSNATPPTMDALHPQAPSPVRTQNPRFESPDELIAQRKQHLAELQAKVERTQRKRQSNARMVAACCYVIPALYLLVASMHHIVLRIGIVPGLCALAGWLVYRKGIDQLIAIGIFAVPAFCLFPEFWHSIPILCLGVIVSICGQLYSEPNLQRQQDDLGDSR